MKKQFLQRIFVFLFSAFFSFPAYSQWTQLSQDTNNMNCSVYFINPDTGFIAGDYGYLDFYIQRTTDGGQTWDSTLVQNGITLMTIYFPNDTIGYCGGQNGGVYKTTNMGQTWFQSGTLPNNDDFGA